MVFVIGVQGLLFGLGRSKSIEGNCTYRRKLEGSNRGKWIAQSNWRIILASEVKGSLGTTVQNVPSVQVPQESQVPSGVPRTD